MFEILHGSKCSFGRIILLILLSFSSISCEKATISSDTHIENVIVADILGDNKLDSIIRTDADATTSITIKKNNIYNHVISLSPLINAKFKLTSPPIENVYIEPNSIQSDEKGLRLIVRNTDMNPDCFYIDLQYHNKWIIETVGIISTTDSIFIKTARINLPVNVICPSGCNIASLARENISLSL